MQGHDASYRIYLIDQIVHVVGVNGRPGGRGLVDSPSERIVFEGNCPVGAAIVEHFSRLQLFGLRSKLSWFAVSGIFLSLIHQVTAIIFTAEAVGATNHLVMGFDEFLFLQIYPPRFSRGDEFDVSISSHDGTYHYVCGSLSVKTAKFKMLIFKRLINVSITDDYLHQISNDAAGRTIVLVFDYRDDACGSFVKSAKSQISRLVQPQTEIVVPFEFKCTGVLPNVLSFEILSP